MKTNESVIAKCDRIQREKDQAIETTAIGASVLMVLFVIAIFCL